MGNTTAVLVQDLRKGDVIKMNGSTYTITEKIPQALERLSPVHQFRAVKHAEGTRCTLSLSEDDFVRVRDV